MHVTSVEGVDDMILLGDLKESAILHNLHMRYKQDHIYVIILIVSLPLSLTGALSRLSPVRFLSPSIPTNCWISTTATLFVVIPIERSANYHRTSSPLVTMPSGVWSATNTINASSSAERVEVARLNRRNWFCNFLPQRVDSIRGSNSKSSMLIRSLKVRTKEMRVL